LQWHTAHIKFCENRSYGLKAEIGGPKKEQCDVTILSVFLLRKESGLITFIQRWRNSSLDPISLVSHQIYCQVWMPMRNNFLLHGFSFL